jgi:hypothetical protein
VLQVIDADGGIQVNNIGTYNANNGVVSITGFAPVSITGGQTYIRLSVILQMKVQLFLLEIMS